ncbi:MAG: gamma-butyrobetaine hydroxylase-like domain-containing protein [Pseudomonadota bacterium]
MINPTEIKLHQKTRLLQVAFEDGAVFELPCEYLRVFSPAAEVRSAEHPATGKESVNLLAIEPQGQYAVRLVFDDGHDTGIYAWETLYSLGRDREDNWRRYLERLQTLGYQRQEPAVRRVRLLYFAWLATKLRRESEPVELPAEITDVASLLAWLGKRRQGVAPLFAEGLLRATVNKQFAESFTRLDEGDEIALVPTHPTPPPTPDLV